MDLKLYRRSIRRAAPAAAASAALLFGPAAAGAQTRCPPAADSAAVAAWSAWRADSVDLAAERFARAARLCPAGDAPIGLGYVALRRGRLGEADSIFQDAVRRHSASSDAWDGLARVAARLGDRARAIAAARRALALDPRRADTRALLHALDPDAERPGSAAFRRPSTLQLPARVRGTRFEVAAADGGWRPFYVQGVNLGVALPGRFPSEFPADSARYAGWLDTLAAMRANTVRVYTILPPAFYRALRGWNLAHPDRALWLVHGVWTELPPGDDFDDPAWKAGFRAEMRRVVDLVHGRAALPPRAGHASGRYDADVSAWTLAYVIGREWEPYAVAAYDARTPGRRPFRGRYLAADAAPAMDRWLAEQCDYMLGYEAERYNALRPIAYTNWPTLDPLAHPTEATAAEEAAWRRRAGRPLAAPQREYENDAIGLDANLVRPTAANPAGWFASYHAYPYYPDFMNLDPGYARARSSEGASNWFGYLSDLVRHHARLPVLVAEYGVPSSRGVAHLQPQGWHHGGHDETAQATIDARLTRELREAGAAGGIVFAWLDEWFKKNWIVLDFEIPAEHTRRWHNVMDAEQNYGILGQYAGDAATTPLPGGDPARWRALPVLQQRAAGAVGIVPGALRVGADESYVYLAVELPGLAGRAFPWDSAGLQIAIDTWLPATGQHALPGGLLRSDVGFEFLVDLPSPATGGVRVTPEYDRHGPRPDPRTGDDLGRFARRPVTIVDREDGRFDSLFVVTNRARFGRDGTFYPAQGYDRGRLRYGTSATSALSDWYYDAAAGVLELRLPWDLLNVTDPSTRTLLFERDSIGALGTVTATGFHFGVVTYAKRGPNGAGARPLGTLPEQWRAEAFRPWLWPTWTEPRSHARLKPVYDSLRAVWARTDSMAPAAGAHGRAPTDVR